MSVETSFSPLSHDAARAFLQDKPAVTRDTFDALLPELRARAMVITDVEDLDVVQRVRDRIARVVGDGEDWDKVRQEIAQDVVPWLGDGADRRAKVLLRTHGNQVYGLADHEVMERQTEVFPYWQYVSSQDEKVRDSHAVLDGIVLPANDPFWQDHYPPWDWNCRCRVVPLMQEDVDAMIEQDKDKPLEERRVLSEGDRERMASQGKLYRTVKRRGTGRAGVPMDVDVRSPQQKGGSYRFSPAEAKMSIEDLRGRYDGDLFNIFEEKLKETKTTDGRTVWEWLQEGSTREADIPRSRVEVGRAVINRSTNRIVRESVNDAIQAVDSVHGDGKLTPLPFVSRQMNALGAYAYSGDHGFQIQINAKGKWPRLTAVHEIGHWLDHIAMGDKGGFASELGSPVMRQWMAAVERSGVVDKLRALKLPKSDIQYYTDPKELWARSYAQFIGQRSTNEAVRKELTDMASPRRINLGLQWTEESFAPIDQAIETMFKEMGWL